MTTGSGSATRSDQPSALRRLLFLGLAVSAGVALSLLAPEDWEAGPGSTTVTYRGEIVLEAPITVGATEPVSHTSTASGVEVELTYPRGVPTDGPVEATITVTRDGERIRVDAGSVALRIELPNGHNELIPVVAWNDSERHLEALRRPPQDSAVVLGLLGFVVVLWVTEAIPLFVTSLMIPVVLVFSGVASAAGATAPFFNPIIVLFFAGFLMAEAMQRCGLDHFIAVSITARSGRNAATLFAAMLVLTAVLSMFMSNTAAAAVLVPIAIAVTAPLGDASFRKALVLGIAYAATIGGVGSAIGTPANQIAIEFLEGFGGRSISFIEWFAFGLPMVVLFVPIMGVYLWKRSRIHVDPERFVEARRVAVDEHRKVGKPDHDQMIVLAVLLAVVAGWLTQTFHGVHAGIVALAGAVALFILGKLLPEDLGRISWPSLLTFGGGLTLGLFLVRTGTSDYLATRLVGLVDVPEVVAVLAVAAITLLLTTVASNTASAAILIPLAIPLAGVLGVSPVGLVMVVAIASSVDFALVVGTPPTMIAYSTHLYTAGQIFRRGIVLDLVGIVLLVFAVTRIWEFFGLV
ncbi:MAG: SLC13 family permease [Actinomycetota bacterium]|nr:SLC13 family permease [Actinomycetota bacterium]